MARRAKTVRVTSSAACSSPSTARRRRTRRGNSAGRGSAGPPRRRRAPGPRRGAPTPRRCRRRVRRPKPLVLTASRPSAARRIVSLILVSLRIRAVASASLPPHGALKRPATYGERLIPRSSAPLDLRLVAETGRMASFDQPSCRSRARASSSSRPRAPGRCSRRSASGTSLAHDRLERAIGELELVLAARRTGRHEKSGGVLAWAASAGLSRRGAAGRLAPGAPAAPPRRAPRGCPTEPRRRAAPRSG